MQVNQRRLYLDGYLKSGAVASVRNFPSSNPLELNHNPSSSLPSPSGKHFYNPLIIMCLSVSPEGGLLLLQGVLPLVVSRPRVYVTASVNESQVHFRPASPSPLLVEEKCYRKHALQQSKLIILQFPSQLFEVCPEGDILLIDELEILHEWDGIAGCQPLAEGRTFCDLLKKIALDPFYNPIAMPWPMEPCTRAYIDAWVEITGRAGFAAYLFDQLSYFPKIEEVILLSSDEEIAGRMLHVENSMKRIAFGKWKESSRDEKAKGEATQFEERDEKEMEKALLNGWEYDGPKITILPYRCGQGEFRC